MGLGPYFAETYRYNKFGNNRIDIETYSLQNFAESYTTFMGTTFLIF